MTGFLSEIEIRGRGGIGLHEVWGEDNGRSYLGLAVPRFPNLFTLYGPNLAAGHGGSLTFLVEAQLQYLASLLQQMDERGMRVIECRPDAFDEYNAEVDALHERLVWMHPRVQSYYRNPRGRVVVNSPFPILEYWHRTRVADLSCWAGE